MGGIRVARVGILGLVLGLTATPALSAPITTPPGLNPGDQYRLAFVGNSGTTTAQSGNIADYNGVATSAANAQAELAALGTTWTAIVSTSSVDARVNTGTNPNATTGVPIYRLDGLKIADNNADLWDGSIQNALSTNSGGTVVDVTPWTGTKSDGTKSTSGTAQPLGGDPAAAGSSSAINGGWIFSSGYNNFTPNPIYAISDVLTVAPAPSVSSSPAPAVSSWGIVGLTGLLLAVGGSMLRRRPAGA